MTTAEMTIADRLRSTAADINKWDGDALFMWDQIRHQVETLKGSDIPRLNFEALIGEYADLMLEAADELEKGVKETGNEVRDDTQVSIQS